MWNHVFKVEMATNFEPGVTPAILLFNCDADDRLVANQIFMSQILFQF